ncbi:hypothetical protein BH10PSE1_BH10PSE1_35210 [soil metagenome]
MNRTAPLLALSILAIVAGCRQPEKPEERPAAPVAAVPNAPEPAVPAVDIANPATEAEAFHAAWNATAPLHRKVDDKGSSRALVYRAAKLIALGGDRYALISSGDLEDAAHVDAGALAIHYLKRTPTGFERTGSWPEFVWDGSFGNAPLWEPRTDITADPAILMTGGGTWQGYTCEWTSLIELTPQAPVMRTESFPTGYDSGGATMDPKDARTMTATVVPDQKGRSFIVRYSGARTASVPYALTGNRYVTTAKPDLLTC